METVNGKIVPGTKCPIMGGKECMQFDCKWWMSIKGVNPNTGEPVEEWNCAVVYQVVASLEGAQQSRQTGAAIESFRNEMVQQGEYILQQNNASIRRSLPPLVGGAPRHE